MGMMSQVKVRSPLGGVRPSWMHWGSEGSPFCLPGGFFLGSAQHSPFLASRLFVFSPTDPPGLVCGALSPRQLWECCRVDILDHRAADRCPDVRPRLLRAQLRWKSVTGGSSGDDAASFPLSCSAGFLVKAAQPAFWLLGELCSFWEAALGGLCVCVAACQLLLELECWINAITSEPKGPGSPAGGGGAELMGRPFPIESPCS